MYGDLDIKGTLKPEGPYTFKAQRAQYSLVKEYTSNSTRSLNMIEGIFLHQGILGSLKVRGKGARI